MFTVYCVLVLLVITVLSVLVYVAAKAPISSETGEDRLKTFELYTQNNRIKPEQP
jgi:hypothetical protein